MTGDVEQQGQADLIAGIRAAFEDRLVPLALRGLPKMLLPDGSVFCNLARRGVADDLALHGSSPRYSAMVLIGLAARSRLGLSSDMQIEPVLDRLVSRGLATADLGDAGLVLWALMLGEDPRAAQIAEALVRHGRGPLEGRGPFSSMSLGWLLTGLGLAIGGGVGGEDVVHLADLAADQLLRNLWEPTGLFALTSPAFRRNVPAARINARLGSFASQVYPTIGLSTLAKATGQTHRLQVAERCADAICRLQGDQGQWWWIYDVRKGRPVVRYPVYGVHQDAMGPMALLAVLNAGAGGPQYLQAIDRSLRWLDDHAECSEIPQVEEDLGIVWRAVQRDDPKRTGAFGLGALERARMHWAAWFGGEETRPFKTGYLCDECRPYHLGWILLASAMVAQVGDTAG
jgi:hypothetical protein